MRQRQGAAAGAEARTIDVLTEIATRFYLGEESQSEIARDLGLDPSTVSRHLKRARSEGIVHIEIRPPRAGRRRSRPRGRRPVRPGPGRRRPDRPGPRRVARARSPPSSSTASCGPGSGSASRWGRTLAAVDPAPPAGRRRRSRDRPAGGRRRRPDAGHPGSRARPAHGRAVPGLARPLPARARDRRRPTTRVASCSPTGRSRRALDAAARRSDVALVGVGAMDEGSTLYQRRPRGPRRLGAAARGGCGRQRQHPLLRRRGPSRSPSSTGGRSRSAGTSSGRSRPSWRSPPASSGPTRSGAPWRPAASTSW